MAAVAADVEERSEFGEELEAYQYFFGWSGMRNGT